MYYKTKGRIESIVTWDWKDEPDWYAIENAIIDVINHDLEFQIISIDTQEDTYAVMIAPKGFTQEVADVMYKQLDVFFPKSTQK